MKLLLSVFIALILLLGSGLIYTYNKLSDLYPTIEALRMKNSNLLRKNTKLTNEKTKLSKKNKKYIANRNSMRSKYKNRRIRLTNQKIMRANKKLISAAPKMIPFVSIPVIVAATSYDIKSYCDEITEMEKFEYELFGEATPVNADDKICGIDVEAKLQQSANSITGQYENILMRMQKEYQRDKMYWSETFDDAKKEVEDKGYSIKSGFSESMESTANYLEEENKKTAKFWKDLFD